jgi:hypothetical protein
MSQPVTIPRGSVEYVKARVTADVTLDDTVGVAISLLPSGTSTHTWLAGEWTGTADTQRVARTSSAVTFDTAYPGSTYSVYVKLTDSPESPILAAGTLKVAG